MAYDGYRSPPPPEQPGFYDYTEPRPSHSGAPHVDIDRQRSREIPGPSDTYNSASVRHHQARQPIDEAVAAAFGGSDNSNGISPEILSKITSQITANVIQQLKATTIQPPSSPHVPPNHTTPFSPTPLATGSEAINRSGVYTPPSPQRPTDDASSIPQASPSHPPHARLAHHLHGRNSPPIDKRAASPVSQPSQADEDTSREGKQEKVVRPKGPTRLSTGTDVTILEKVWGTLFDEEAKSTRRLGQFLRGIAVHLIEDYEPVNSLVITPSKMQKYYEDTKLSSEPYPWGMIFDDHTSSISRLYREVEAEHHLVQERFDERPDIPGLTPFGFERWVTLLLLAHPDQEFERLQKAVLDMPISNPDDKKERFPKEISRRLFPIHQDHQIREKLEKAMASHCNVTFPRRHSSGGEPQRPIVQPTPIHYPPSSGVRQEFVAPPSTSTRFSPPPGAERQRQPYSNKPSEGATDDDEDNIPTPQPIERERKPYSAQPGGGKHYDDVNRPPTPPDHKAAATNRSNRSASNVSSTRPLPINVQRPHTTAVDGYPLSPDPSLGGHHRRNSVLDHQSPVRQVRNRSPSTSTSGRDYGHRSEGDVAYGSSSFNPSYWSSTAGDVGDDGRRNREYDRERPISDRHDPSRMSMYDLPKEREKEPRGRFQSSASVENSRPHHSNDEDYYRATGGTYGTSANGYSQYSSGSSYR